MQIPRFTKGEIIRASDLNRLGDLSRNTFGDNPTERNANRKNLKPFDVIQSYINDNGKWEFKLNPGVCYTPGGVQKDITVGTLTGDVSLSTYPPIELFGEYQGTVYKESNLVFNYENKKLGWQPKDEPYNMIIIEPIYYENGDVRLVNKHPGDIDLRTYPPLTEVMVNDGLGSIKVGATPGLVIERVVTDDDCVINHAIDGLQDGNDIKFYAIASNQQFSVIFATNDQGTITGDPACYVTIEPNGTESIHYQPKTASETAGTEGLYHFPLVKNGGAARVCARSHIEYDEDIDQLNNALDPAPNNSNQARIVREWDEAESKWILRRIQTLGGQMACTESTDNVDLRGNSKDGTAVVKVNGVDAGPILGWSDGFVTSNQDIVWNVNIPALSSYPLSGGSGDLDYKIGNDTAVSLIDWNKGSVQNDGNFVIPIPEIVAGENITISETNNVFTISSSLTGTWINAWFCIDGTPTEKQVLVRDIPV